MNGWDALIAGVRWPKCRHLRTPENTRAGYHGKYWIEYCRTCLNAENRDYRLGHLKQAARKQRRYRARMKLCAFAMVL